MKLISTSPKKFAWLAVSCLLLSLFGLTQTTTPTAQAYAGRTPGMVAAFYYPWYDPRDPGSYWDPNKMSSLPATKYNSGDRNYLKTQMQQAKDAGIDAFIVAWNGPTGDWADRLNWMLEDAPAGFTIAVHYETGLTADNGSPSVALTVDNLKFIRDKYANSPKYMRYQGKPLVYFWRPGQVQGGGGDSNTAATNSLWRNIRNQVDPNNLMLWSTDGVDTNLLQVFDSIHLFSALWSQADPGNSFRNFRARVDQFNRDNGTRRLWTAGVTPGVDDRKLRPGSPSFRDRAAGAYYQTSWNAAISSNPDLITVSTWNEWYEGSSVEPGEAWGNQYLDITKQNVPKYKNTLTGFGDGSISKVWNRTDLPVDSGAVKRSYLWGPPGTFKVAREAYAEAPGGSRMVYYFDKARMEITVPNDKDPDGQFFVTNGLLVREMMRGNLQTGNSAEENRAPATVPVAGDLQSNPNSPTYASMAGVASLASDKPAGNKTNQPATERMAGNGQVSNDPGTAQFGVTYAYFESKLGHNIAKPFWDFFNQSGTVIENGNAFNGQVIDWITAMGLPLTEAYWAKVTVGGVEKDVLIQAFERRVMTYTPSNSPEFRVEMGNVGLQYYQWRYGGR